MTPCAITHAACIQLLFSASCLLLSASNSPLPALCTRLPALHSYIELSAPCFLLPTSCLLRSLPLLSTLYSLRPLLSAICFLLPASCFLRTLPLPFTLYSLLTASALSALCPQPSAFCSLSFNRHPPKNGLPGSCIDGVRAAALPHTEKNACGVRPHVAPPRYLSATSLPSLHPG